MSIHFEAFPPDAPELVVARQTQRLPADDLAESGGAPTAETAP